MRYGSVCSGIEAATAAWHTLGWQPAWFSEIEGFPSAVLAHHYPNVPNLGDMTQFQEWPDAAIDVLVGGTPCQSFSVAGLRNGLDDPRGNLMLTFGAIAARYRPAWLVWENVPGVLSSNGGRDFGTFLGMLAELGYGFAYRVLDAQFFGVAQRRRRVFVVGHLGDWHCAAAVLFERESLRGDPAPRRESRQGTAGSTGDGLARCLTAGEAKRQDWETCNFVAQPLTFPWQMGGSMQIPVDWDVSGTLVKSQTPAVAFDLAQITSSTNRTRVSPELPASTLNAAGQMHVAENMAVRRLTPRECERLQGFPDDYTAIPYRGKPADQCPDGPRYKALGNSMAVPVMAWIGRRIAMVSEIVREEAA